MGIESFSNGEQVLKVGAVSVWTALCKVLSSRIILHPSCRHYSNKVKTRMPRKNAVSTQRCIPHDLPIESVLQ